MRSLLVVLIFVTSLASEASTHIWKKVAQEDNIQVFTRKTSSSLLPFKAEGVINANVDQILEALKNHKTKHKWSPKLKSVKLHKELAENEYIFSEYYKTPWPAYDREFLLKGSIKQLAPSKYQLKASSIDDKDLQNNSHVQANVKTINVVIEKVALNKTKIIFEFYGDMKGWMPIWLMNIIQKKWPLRFIQGLRSHVALNQL